MNMVILAIWVTVFLVMFSVYALQRALKYFVPDIDNENQMKIKPVYEDGYKND